MAQKLLLAEGLDLLRRTEAREYDVDCSQVRISGSNKYRKELSRLAQAYAAVYQDYLRGVEILNYVRRCAMESDEPNSQSLVELCEGKMRAYMDRCEGVRKKEDNILLPLNQVDSYVAKAAFEVGEPVFVLMGAQYVLKRKEGFSREETLTDGSYLIVVKNLDSYSVAAPQVSVCIDIVPQRGQKQRLEKVIPCQCGWRRVIGVVASAALKLEAHTDGLLRDSHIDIALYRLEPSSLTTPSTGTGAQLDTPGAMAEKLVAELPKLSDDELKRLASPSVSKEGLSPPVPHEGDANDADPLMQQLQSLKVPHTHHRASSPAVMPERIEVSPANMTCADRMRRLRATLNVWPDENVMAAPLSREQQCTLQAVFALPFPTEIGD
ncbi:hypothetical protein DQ04_01581090 [Trypanosoma grayi]|uniref:hypothetical protein n=1 Tax=Trypanosoma grayi TaxID=71804 RepID=UPI0004F45B7D|nr:hypothetical protein DQ04_01581090 [Trypanosoma grayi]KEG12612.1 hypothetical protein DQ04_01581090 [Trypanosoma grayi]